MNQLSLLCELPMMESVAMIHKDDDFDADKQAKLDELMKPCVDKIIDACK